LAYTNKTLAAPNKPVLKVLRISRAIEWDAVAPKIPLGNPGGVSSRSAGGPMASRGLGRPMAKLFANDIQRAMDRAAEAERLAWRATYPAAKAELLDLANQWRKVAAEYEQVEKLETFLRMHKGRPVQSSEN
jgi:hypothetical protein